MDRTEYRRWVRRMAGALVRAQKEIRVLKALHWPDSVGQRFLRKKGRELPVVEYAPLDFDPEKKVEEFRSIEELLDPADPLQEILRETAQQYTQVVGMLAARGTSAFHDASRRLYGYPLEPFAGQTTTSLDLAHHLDRLLPSTAEDAPPKGPLLSAEETSRLLERRLGRAFKGARVRVEVSANLTADAAAGADRLRIKKGRMFGRETIDYLEQHEGYVHIATTLNGRRQHHLPILGKASPRGVRVNEGLAVFSEWASHTLTVKRLRRLMDRILAIRMAEEGADFRDLYRHYVDRGESSEAAYDIARRVFRGGDIRGGAPFTKDASYLGDFLRIYNFTRIAVRRRRLDLLDLLFAGKVTIPDIPVLARHANSGEVRRPRYLPPWIKDRNWLLSHMALSSFLNAIRLDATDTYYEELFSRCPPPPDPDGGEEGGTGDDGAGGTGLRPE
jgi:uncharacterized protein (TIGR02421 family)